MSSTQSITIESVGRRHYVRGNTYPIKDQLRAAGCKWDGAAKAWWTGKRDVAERFAGQAPSSSPGSDRGADRPAPGDDQIVAARAIYKGRTYYVCGRTDRGRTHWDDQVSAVETRDGSRVLLAFRDGSKSFWAPRAQVSIIKSYDRPQTIGSLRAYAEQARSAGVGQIEDGYYLRGGEVLASGCGECSRLGRMCRSCEHDYA